MSERDYYPLGAYDDPRAPYNEPLDEERDVYVTMSFCASTYKTNEDFIDEIKGLFPRDYDFENIKIKEI